MKNLRNTLAGIAVVAAAVAPAISSAHENKASVKADVRLEAHGHDGLRHAFRDMRELAHNAVTGTVSAVNNGVLTITKTNGTSATVQTNSSTSVKGDGKTATLADVTVGTKVAVKGTWDSTHTVLTATKIAIVNKLHPVRDWLGNLFAQHVVAGSVTAVSGNTITVKGNDGAVYSVNAASAKFFDKSETSATISDVKVGDKVQVFGTVSGTSVTAEMIHDVSVSK